MKPLLENCSSPGDRKAVSRLGHTAIRALFAFALLGLLGFNGGPKYIRPAGPARSVYYPPVSVGVPTRATALPSRKQPPLVFRKPIRIVMRSIFHSMSPGSRISGVVCATLCVKLLTQRK